MIWIRFNVKLELPSNNNTWVFHLITSILMKRRLTYMLLISQLWLLKNALILLLRQISKWSKEASEGSWYLQHPLRTTVDMISSSNSSTLRSARPSIRRKTISHREKWNSRISTRWSGKNMRTFKYLNKLTSRWERWPVITPPWFLHLRLLILIQICLPVGIKLIIRVMGKTWWCLPGSRLHPLDQ